MSHHQKEHVVVLKLECACGAITKVDLEASEKRIIAAMGLAIDPKKLKQVTAEMATHADALKAGVDAAQPVSGTLPGETKQ